MYIENLFKRNRTVIMGEGLNSLAAMADVAKQSAH